MMMHEVFDWNWSRPQAPLLQVHYSSDGAGTKQRDRDKTERRRREESVCVNSLRFLLHIFLHQIAQPPRDRGLCPLYPRNPVLNVQDETFLVERDCQISSFSFAEWSSKTQASWLKPLRTTNMWHFMSYKLWWSRKISSQLVRIIVFILTPSSVLIKILTNLLWGFDLEKCGGSSHFTAENYQLQQLKTRVQNVFRWSKAIPMDSGDLGPTVKVPLTSILLLNLFKR